MGSNARKTGNPADRMAGRTLGWGTRSENKEKRKDRRTSANEAEVELGLEEWETYYSGGYIRRHPRTDPCYCNSSGCYECDPSYARRPQNAPKKKKKKGCKGKDKLHQWEPFARVWDYGNGRSTTSDQFKCKQCGKISWPDPR
jgi:hypothetical protein